MMEGMGVNHAHIKLCPMCGIEYMKEGKRQQYPSDSDHDYYLEKYER